jgi:hypothetical protein
VSSKRIIKHQNAKGRTLYGLILTPAELMLIRGMVGILSHNDMSYPTKRRHLNLWEALLEARDASVHFDTAKLKLLDKELIALLDQEALEEDPFE